MKRTAARAKTRPTKPALPSTFKEFVARFPAISRAHETTARAVQKAGPLDRKTCALIKIGISIGAGLESATRSHVRRAAEQAGRNPDRITLSLRWNSLPEPADKPQLENVQRALHGYRDAGVQHICFDLNIPQPRPLAAMMEMMERLKEITASVEQG